MEKAAEPADPGVGGREEGAAAETDGPIEGGDVTARELRVVPELPQRLGVRPCGIAGPDDVPHGDDVVQPVDAMEDPVEPVEPAAQVLLLDPALDGREDSIDPKVVG